MYIDENEIIQYPIKMTSNTTQSPFNIEYLDGTFYDSTTSNDIYRLFDESTSTNAKRVNNLLSFKLTLDKKILLKKLKFYGYGTNASFLITSMKIYGIDDNGNKILLGSKENLTSSDYINRCYTLNCDNNNFYETYQFDVNGRCWYLMEFMLYGYSNDIYLLNNDGSYKGIDASYNKVISFNDINDYLKYGISKYELNNNIISNITETDYPFKSVKFVL